MTILTEEYDERRDLLAHDTIRKYMEKGMTEEQALLAWQEPFCSVCGMERIGEFEMLHELHKHYRKVNRKEE